MKLYKILFIFLNFINNSYTYNLGLNSKKIKNLNNNIKLGMREEIFLSFDKLLDTEMNNKQLGRIIVEQISSMLPKVDSIGHNILHANNEFINYILEHNLFDDATKKSIILASIRLAQYGDDAGSQILQLYYDIVEKCL
jgi:hypothetical protein